MHMTHRKSLRIWTSWGLWRHLWTFPSKISPLLAIKATTGPPTKQLTTCLWSQSRLFDESDINASTVESRWFGSCVLIKYYCTFGKGTFCFVSSIFTNKQNFWFTTRIFINSRRKLKILWILSSFSTTLEHFLTVLIITNMCTLFSR